MAEPRYHDFDDLRDNRQAELQADIAIDLVHPDPARLDAAWPATGDGGFRLSLTQAVADFWEKAVHDAAKAKGKTVPEDHFAIEILVDSYADPDMGHSLLLELHAYCGTEALGELCWAVFDTAALETAFCREFPARTLALLGELTDLGGFGCEVEVTEVAEI
ncbi:MAG TPA: hypothetical protein PLQ13_00915 [Candidatus Krumholzibacteria bacterium]|nr:hypothetical protein [Candidatus Krumholzibacteria bacterium]